MRNPTRKAMTELGRLYVRWRRAAEKGQHDKAVELQSRIDVVYKALREAQNAVD